MSPHPRRLHPAAPERLVDLQSLPTLTPKHLGDSQAAPLAEGLRAPPACPPHGPKRQSESVMLTVFPTFSLPLGSWTFPGFSRRDELPGDNNILGSLQRTRMFLAPLSVELRFSASTKPSGNCSSTHKAALRRRTASLYPPTLPLGKSPKTLELQHSDLWEFGSLGPGATRRRNSALGSRLQLIVS